MYSFYDYLPKAQTMGQWNGPEDQGLDYGAYQADMQQNGYYPQQGYEPQVPNQQVRWHPEWDDNGQPDAYPQMQPSSQAMPPSRGGGYNPNVSVVDYLSKSGKSDFASRKIMAENLGIKNYKGTAAQNNQLLHSLVNNAKAVAVAAPNNPSAPNIPIAADSIRNPGFNMNNYTNKVDSSNFYNQALGAAAGFVSTGNNPMGAYAGYKLAPSSSTSLKLLGIAGGLTAAAGLTAMEAKYIKDQITNGAFKSPAQIQEAIEQIKTNTVSKVGQGIKDLYKTYAALPKRQRDILNTLDENEISGVAHTLEPGAAAAHNNAWMMGKESDAENTLMNAHNTSQALQDIDEEAKAMRIFNAKKVGPKLAEEAKPLASEIKPAAQMLKEAWMAAKATPWIAKSAQYLSKLKGLQDGGENNMYQNGGYTGYDGRHHNNGGHGTYSNGVYFQDGGEEMDYGGMYMQYGGHASPRVDYNIGVQPFAGYMQDGGGTNNPGFNALPDYVQHKILSNMQNGGDLGFSPMYAQGGIHLNPANRGTFTAAATRHGKSVQGFASQVLANKQNYSPAMVKKANFARNASHWNHAEGGSTGNYQVGGSYNVSPEEAQRLKSLGYKIQIQ